MGLTREFARTSRPGTGGLPIGPIAPGDRRVQVFAHQVDVGDRAVFGDQDVRGQLGYSISLGVVLVLLDR